MRAIGIQDMVRSQAETINTLTAELDEARAEVDRLTAAHADFPMRQNVEVKRLRAKARKWKRRAKFAKDARYAELEAAARRKGNNAAIEAAAGVASRMEGYPPSHIADAIRSMKYPGGQPDEMILAVDESNNEALAAAQQIIRLRVKEHNSARDVLGWIDAIEALKRPTSATERAAQPDTAPSATLGSAKSWTGYTGQICSVCGEVIDEPGMVPCRVNGEPSHYQCMVDFADHLVQDVDCVVHSDTLAPVSPFPLAFATEHADGDTVAMVPTECAICGKSIGGQWYGFENGRMVHTACRIQRDTMAEPNGQESGA